jgi:multidrug resistance efflux pump
MGIQAIVTYTMAGRLSASLLLLCIVTIIAVIFMGLFQLWKMRVNETIQQNLLADIGIRFSKKVARLSPDLYLSTYIPTKINQFFDVLTLQKGLTKILLELSYAVISIVFGLIILSTYNPLFILFSVVTAGVFLIIIRVSGDKALKTSMAESKMKYQFVDTLQNMFLSLKNKDGKYTPQEMVHSADDALANYIQEKSKHFRILDSQYKSILYFKVSFTAFLLLLGIWLVQTGYINIGQFVASEILVILIIDSVEKLVMNLETVYDVLTATEKLYQVFELDEDHYYEEDTHSTKGYAEVYGSIYNYSYSTVTKRLIYFFLLLSVVTLLLPWNQTIDCEGKVTTMNPTDRPQTIPSRISGRIEKWFVKEGQFIHKGDTIAFISEIKDDYFDPQLIERTQSQLSSKESSIGSYEQKINAIDQQLDALNTSQRLKLEQAKNKLIQARNKAISDSIEFTAISKNNEINEEQFKRYEELLTKGVISKTDYESRKAKLQESASKKIAAENKWINSKNDILNAMIEMNAVKQEYSEKSMKAESDKFSALSALYDAEAGLTKMQNQLANYSIRNSYYYVTAPQDGYITQSYVQGVGDIVKDGAPLVSFVPNSNNLSAELYVEPMDLPLIRIGAPVQLTFDGWPALVFSGWPGVSTGTYTAKVAAIDRVISSNGKFRILVVKDKHEWPFAIQVGGGVRGLALLNKVPLVYEIWRKVNGFPPQFYKDMNSINNSDEKKKK